MATGLLVVLVGRPATRHQDHFMRQRKEYTGTVRLGETTASLDAETEVDIKTDASHVTWDRLEAVTPQFTGSLMQLPPAYSAIKQGGERLYKKARRGEEVTVPPRSVTVYALHWTGMRSAGKAVEADFAVTCSKGTYIRSLARDLGKALGVGGHLTMLRRTAIGDYRVEDAWPLEAFEQAMLKEGAS